MSLDGKIGVVLGYNRVKHYFISRVVQNNDSIKTKTISINKFDNVDKAYDAIVTEAKILAKTYKAEFFQTSKKDLLSRGKQAIEKKAPRIPKGDPIENPLIAKFGNELAFKAMIKNAVKHHGLDKTIEVLESALSLAKGMQAEIAKEKSIISSANIEIARVIVKTRNQGVHMASPSKEIDAAIQWVIENDNKPKLSRKAEPNARYKLQKDEWDGTGQAPVSITQYLAANENRTLDDLRIN
jgi:hypothetical protein